MSFYSTYYLFVAANIFLYSEYMDSEISITYRMQILFSFEILLPTV